MVMTDATGGPDPEWGKEVDEDEPVQPDKYHFATEFGFMEPIPPRPYPADLPELTPEEMREAATRYLKARYAQATDPWVTGQVWREAMPDERREPEEGLEGEREG